MPRKRNIVTVAKKGVVSTQRPRVLSSCVMVDSPHSGREYPSDFAYTCDFNILRQAEDAYLDALFDFLPSIGIPFVQAHFPRSYIDPNRPHNAPDLLRQTVTPRYQVPIYAIPPDVREAFNRYAAYHKPYHDALCSLRRKVRQTHGRVVHLNCHSLPSVLLEGNAPYPYDIIIGTRDGTSAAPHLAIKLKQLFEARGYRVALNAQGFRGAEILRRSGRPDKNTHAIQIEINRRLYLNEENVTLRQPDAQKLRDSLKAVISDFRDYCDGAAFTRKPPARTPNP